MDTVSRKALDSNKLLQWMYENGYFSLNAADMIADEMEKGTFDLTESEGEAALRVDNERLRAEVDEWKRYYDKLLERKERLVAAIQRGETIHFATLDEGSSTSETAVQPLNEDFDINAWADRIIEGRGGMNAFERYEWIVWNEEERNYAAKWILRCLANPNYEDGDKVLQAIMERRREVSGIKDGRDTE